MIVRAKDGRNVATDDGTLVAYVGRREGWREELWFVAPMLPERLARAAQNAVFSLDGLPPAATIARKINEALGA